MPNSLLKRALGTTAVVAIGATIVAAPAQAGGHRGPDNIAHHGAAGEAPENTIAAIDLAFDQGADFVEVEVQRTADGELVVVNDLGLARTTDVEQVFPARLPWLLSGFTLAELRQLDAGSWFGAEFAGERIPTLREVIAEVGYRNGLAIDIRNPQLYPGIERDVWRELLSNPSYLLRAVALDHLVVKSSNIASATAFHDLARIVEVGVVFDSRPADEALVAASAFADQVDLVYTEAVQARIDRIEELGMDVVVHTVNTDELYARYDERGADGIVTTFPARLAAYLN